ncbi:hypothetical protein G6011_08768 [Alternaria panax]|uniref:Tail specific protease domain-containing protein n=1 Tax=Alternaria panax TaxID=48097 RepID=A0AAD4I6E0_9PLEO|nr:hypothetical protein G6011_08768 [Alternaria panax]
MLKSTLLLASAALVTAQSSSSEPCAAAAADLRQSSTIEAQVAFDCLDSVPVNVQGNTQLVEELKQIWQFQSELVWLKKPGDDWEFGPLDIEAELDNVKDNLDSFSSEYAVQIAIQNITIRTGNFHFNYQPDILTVFDFSRQINVASISEDGKALPKLYVADDVASLAEGSSDVSEITDINGQNPYDFLKSTSWSQYIDSDGLINSMLSKGDTDNLGSFMNQRKYDGPSTDITWANGSTVSIPNGASSVYASRFAGITDGQSFFDTFCTGSSSPLFANTKADSESFDVALPKPKIPAGISHIIAPSAPGPVPRIPTGVYHRRNKRQTMTPSSGSYAENVIEKDSSGTVAGYFLNGDGYDDVAVLKIISFSNPGKDLSESDFCNEFQATIASFLSKCMSENKQKLIIDLRENGGGSTNLLLDAFMQLFPEMEPFSGQRYRATDAFVKIGDAINEIRSDPVKARMFAQYNNESIEESNKFRYWSWWHFRNADGVDFSGWDDFNGPVDLNDDSYTKTMRYNYTDEVSILLEGWRFVNGTRPTPFNASNIVMYTDALCGSSCASFHEELKNIAGIKAVTVGGRPEKKPIQTVTGSKGGEVTPLIYWQIFAQGALNLSSALSLSSYSANDDVISAIANVPQIVTRAGDQASRLQSQDQVRKGDASGTPLQYIYEASDCKIFYTATTYADPGAAWRQAWDAFQDDSKCVEGSTGHASSISGGFKAYGPGELKAEDQPNGNGAGNGGNGDDGNAASTAGVSRLVFAVATVVLSAMIV